jgi:hypothetical protein
MALTPLNVGGVVQWEHPNDPDKGTEGATVFKIKILDAYILQTLLASAFPSRDGKEVNTEIVKETFEAMYDIVRFGLAGWNNFNSIDGKPIPFLTEMDDSLNDGRPRDVVSRATMQKIRASGVPNLLYDIAGAVISNNGISGEESKNLPSQS